MLELVEVQGVAVRDTQMIADEINAIKEKTRDAVISGAIEIGKRLVEAKNMLPTGAWGAWLKTNVEYSERTAQNLMSIFNEYGRKGIPEGLQRASLTNALALIGLPDDMKHDLIESGDAEELSTRELKKKIEQMQKEKEEAQVTIDSLLGKQSAAEQNRKAEAARAAEAEKNAADAREAMLAATEKARQEQEKNQRLQKELEAAREAAQEPRADVKPEVIEIIPEDVMKELNELRSLARQNTSANEVLFRDTWSRLIETYNHCAELAEMIARESGAEKADKLKGALSKALRGMADKLGA